MEREGWLLLVIGLGAAALLVAFMPSGSEGKKMGAPGVSETGCTCHEKGNGKALLSLDGMPRIYEPGRTYRIEMGVSGGANSGKGGFDMAASAGAFSGNSTWTKLWSGTEVSHFTSNSRQWSVDWTAPPKGTGRVRFTLAGNAADGGGTTDGDAVNRTVFYTFENNTPGTLLDSVRAAPEEVVVGEAVGITARVVNLGNADAKDVAVELYLDSGTVPVEVKRVALLPKLTGSVNVSFEWNTSAVAEAGNHTLTVAASEMNLTAEIRVMPAGATLFIKSAGADRTYVNRSESVGFNVTVRNIASQDVAEDFVDFVIDGRPAGSAQFAVSARGEALLTYTWNTSLAEEGNHSVVAVVRSTGASVDAGNITVHIPGPMFVVDDVTLEPSAPVEGREVSVDVLASNTGDLPGVAAVFVYAGTDLLLQDNLTIQPGESGFSRAAWTPNRTGVQTIRAIVSARECSCTVERLLNVTVKNSPAAVYIHHFAADPAVRDVTDESVEWVVNLTLHIINSGGSPGNVTAHIYVLEKPLYEENVTVPARGEYNLTFRWTVSGDRLHWATANLTGPDSKDRGLWVAKSRGQMKAPGFEAALLLASAAVAVALLRKR